MNGTIVDIPGISVSVIPIYMEDTPDTSYVMTIKDSTGKTITIAISFEKINNIKCEK